MKLKLVILIIFNLSFIAGCGDKSNVDDLISEQLNEIYQADPIYDFEQAIRNKDTKFKGLNVGRLVVPIVSGCLIDEFKVDVISGTSDAIENYEHAKLQAVARVYAEDYNLRMLRYIVENNLSKCENSEEKIYHSVDS